MAEVAEAEAAEAAEPLPQPGNLKLPMRVRQLNCVGPPGSTRCVYQNVQSSTGSMVRSL